MQPALRSALLHRRVSAHRRTLRLRPAAQFAGHALQPAPQVDAHERKQRRQWQGVSCLPAFQVQRQLTAEDLGNVADEVGGGEWERGASDPANKQQKDRG